MERTEDIDGRLVHRVQYTNFWHVLDDEQWRRVADTGPELDHARAGAGDAALRDGASLAASRLMRWDNARGETAGGASETTGEAGSAETTGQAGSAPDLNWPGRRRVRRSAAMELLRTRDEAEQREARRPDDAPMLSRHSATLSRHLVWVRRLLREYLGELAEDGLSVPMQRTSRGLHPTMRWTVEFGEWLATTRTVESRACSWHLAEEESAGQAEATALSGRGSNTVYVALQHMKNHVWRELWPAMPADARQYWHWVTRRVMERSSTRRRRRDATGCREGSGMEAGQAAAQASVARGEGAVACQSELELRTSRGGAPPRVCISLLSFGARGDMCGERAYPVSHHGAHPLCFASWVFLLHFVYSFTWSYGEANQLQALRAPVAQLGGATPSRPHRLRSLRGGSLRVDVAHAAAATLRGGGGALLLARTAAAAAAAEPALRSVARRRREDGADGVWQGGELGAERLCVEERGGVGVRWWLVR